MILLCGATLVLTGLLGGSILCIVYFSYLRRVRRPGEPPIVPGNFILGNAAEFRNHAVAFLLKACRQHGDVFTIRLIGQYMTIIMDPHSYDSMSKEKRFDFGPIRTQVNKNVFNYTLFDEKKMIAITAKALKGSIFLESFSNFVNNLETAYVSVEASATTGWTKLRLKEFASRTLFDAIFNTIFGRQSDHAPFQSSIVYKNFEIFHKYFNYLWLGFPSGLFPKACQALKELFTMPESTEMLSRPDISIHQVKSLKAMLEQGHGETDMKAHSLIYLHVNYNTFRLAFWVLSNILQCKEAETALRSEVEAFARTDSEGYDKRIVKMTAKDVESLKILDSIVQESCRLASGVFMVRYVTEDTYFATSKGETFLIREGDRVAIYPPALHKDPELFENPEDFKYDRFVDGKFFKAGREVKHPVMAFGSLCPGKRNALLQLKWFILTALTRFDLRQSSEAKAEYDTTYYGHEILPPVTDVDLEFRPREHHFRFEFSH